MSTNEQVLMGEKMVTDCTLKQSMKTTKFILGTSLICEYLCTVSHAVLTQWLAAHYALGTDFLPSVQALLQEQ